MRLAVVHDWPVHFEQEYTWRDGLAAAIRILSRRYELKFWGEGPPSFIPHPYFPIRVSPEIPAEVAEFKPDAIIMWGDCTRPNAKPLAELGKPMALCFAGGDPQRETNAYFDHFFVESAAYEDKFRVMGKSVSRAFGTNTELFQPVRQERYFSAIFPATFADWKRHKLFAKAMLGLPSLAVGYMYEDHEQECWQICASAGILTLPHVSAEVLRRLYAASFSCVITSDSQGGSQRTVLEAMAMNVPVIVMEDSDKTTEYVREGGGLIVPPDPKDIRDAVLMFKDVPPPNSREYVLSKWSETHYADAMDAWLRSL